MTVPEAAGIVTRVSRRSQSDLLNQRWATVDCSLDILGAMTSTADRATALRALHTDPTLLTLVNVWDVASARIVAQAEGTRAIATASHAIAAMYGYEDGENIPRDLMLEAVGRVVDAVDLPVTADLEAGYGDAAETVRRAIGLGVVGCNIEDQMRPLGEATGIVEAVMRAAADEGVPDFVLNARTDAFLRSGDRDPDDVARRRDRARTCLPRGRCAGGLRARPPHRGRRSSRSSTRSGRSG